MTKPGDLLLGVQDFFAVLMPGAVATWLLAQYAPERWARHVDLAGTPGASGDVLRWTVFLFSSYVLGHFVFGIGSKLDGSYDRWRRRVKPVENDLVYKAADKLRNELHGELRGGHFTTLKWARAYVGIHAPEARAEIERYEAASKFFRGMVIVAVALAIHFLIAERSLGLAALSAALGALSFERYCDQRWKSTELSYGTALILHQTRSDSPAPRRGAESEGG
jgi:hypothetical protein